MELQATKFVKGGFNTLENEIQAQREKGFVFVTLLSDDGDFFTVFRKITLNLNMTTENFVRTSGSFGDLEKELNQKAEEGWFVTMLANDDSNFLFGIAKAVTPSTHEHDFENYLLNYGND